MRFLFVLLLSGCATYNGPLIDVGPYKGPRPQEVIWEKPKPIQGVPLDMCVA